MVFFSLFSLYLSYFFSVGRCLKFIVNYCKFQNISFSQWFTEDPAVPQSDGLAAYAVDKYV